MERDERERMERRVGAVGWVGAKLSEALRKMKRLLGVGVLGVLFGICVVFVELLRHTREGKHVLMRSAAEEEAALFAVFTVVFFSFFSAIFKDPGTARKEENCELYFV